jgi:actin-like ATPase involved in cell morphogenesis
MQAIDARHMTQETQRGESYKQMGGHRPGNHKKVDPLRTGIQKSYEPFSKSLDTPLKSLATRSKIQ